MFMSTDLVLVIDAGTTGCRGVAFASDGEVQASAYNEFPSSYPHPNWIEQNAEDWWKTICASTKAVMNHLAEGTEIAAVSVTNQRETVVAVDENGKPLRPALVWQDRRSTEQCRWIEQNIGAEKIYETTGLTIDPYFTAPKLLWLKEHETEIFENASRYLLVHDYIIHKLTGRTVTEPSNASRTMLFDLEARKWSDELLERFGIPAEKLPEVQPPGTFVNELTTTAANETGLPDGTHVYTGGGDQQCAALGCGVIAPGRVKATTGTGTFCLAYTDDIKLDTEHRRVLCSAHAVEGAYVVEASIFTTGAAYRWLRDNFAKELLDGDLDPYEVLNEEAESSEPGARGVTFIPHLAGAGAPHWNANAVGVIHGLSLGHTRGDIVRAMMEGVAVELRKNLEVMRSMDLTISELRVTGGGARSILWNQITADMTDMPVLKLTEDATALGAAVLAAVGAKIHKNLEKASEAMIKTGAELEPNKNLIDIYQDVYERSIKLYEVV
jgi:D-xylulose kinase